MSDPIFLSKAELRELTSYAHRGKQIAELRRLGIAFWINAANEPKVARTTIEGSKAPAQPKPWEPAWAANRL